MMTANAAARPLEIDLILDAAVWDAHPDAAETVRRAVTQAAAAIEAQTAGCGLVVLLTDDATVRTLNRQWLGLDKPTNVLSFPGATPPAGTTTRHLGDIAIAHETLAREAQAEGKPLAHHLAHLCVHGFLHLLGYDHESEPDAETMEQLERTVLASLGVPDPYLTHEIGA